MKWTLYGPDVLAAWVAEMDFRVAPPIRAALIEAIDREDFGYTPADTTDLSKACAEFVASAYGWAVPSARVFPVIDVLAGITGALDLFVPPGTDVVDPTPTYPPFFAIVERTGRRVVQAPLVDDDERPTLDLAAIATALSSGARCILLSNPQN